MIDDEKRRETARRLRAAAEQADPAVGVSELEIFCILDVDMGGERGFANRQDVLRLADLIDRPARQGKEAKRTMSGREPKTRLSASEREVLSLIAEYGDGGAVIAKDSLAKTIGRTVRTAQRVVRYLRENGLIESIPQSNRSGGTSPNLYVITPKGLMELRKERNQEER